MIVHSLPGELREQSSRSLFERWRSSADNRQLFRARWTFARRTVPGEISTISPLPLLTPPSSGVATSPGPAYVFFAARLYCIHSSAATEMSTMDGNCTIALFIDPRFCEAIGAASGNDVHVVRWWRRDIICPFFVRHILHAVSFVRSSTTCERLSSFLELRNTRAIVSQRTPVVLKSLAKHRAEIDLVVFPAAREASPEK